MAEMTESRLRALYGEPSPRAARKVIEHFDDHCRSFIAHAPFLVLATTDVSLWMFRPKATRPDSSR